MECHCIVQGPRIQSSKSLLKIDEFFLKKVL